MNLCYISIFILISAITLGWLSFPLATFDLLLKAAEFLIKTLLNTDIESTVDINVWQEYDFIVVGGGTAGCVLANRLSENSSWKILLIEAGLNENVVMDIPLLTPFMQTSEKLNWQYKSEKSYDECLAMTNNQCNLPQGKVMGGSSVLNYMIYTRGNKQDFDGWAKMGNDGWSFEDVLPYFKKLENVRISNIDKDFQGTSGPVTVSYVNYKSNLSTAFIDGMKEMGISNLNYNGKHQVGVSHIQTTTKNGYRVSSNRAYIDPIKNTRENLHIKTATLVTKILIDDVEKVATGVEFYHYKKLHTVTARKEIIISAGAINSPKLLMISGIGPKEHLESKQIETILDLPVGKNLMDHVSPLHTFRTSGIKMPKAEMEEISSSISYYTNGAGPYSMSAGSESLAFFDSNDFVNPEAYPDVEIVQVPAAIHDHKDLKTNMNIKDDLYEQVFKPLEDNKIPAFSIGGYVLRPKSRGFIELESKNPFNHPLIYPNYYSEPEDIKISLKLTKRVLALESTAAFKRINATYHKTSPPDCLHYKFNSSIYWECFLRHYSYTVYHYSGTCKMGHSSDKTAVVDSRLRVIGMKNLRVVDASVMPKIVSGHPNAAVLMIAEKASDMIKQDWD